MKKFLLAFAAWAVLLLPTYPAYCAGDADLLNELDLAIGEEEVKVSEEGDRSFGAQVARNLDLSVRLRGYHYFETATEPLMVSSGAVNAGLDRQDNYGEIKIDFGSVFESDGGVLMAMSGWLETGNQKDTYKADLGLWQDKDRQRNILEINELYFTVPAGPVDVTLGKRIIDNSISTIFCPANRYNSFDLNDPLDPHQFGTWQLALEGDVSDVSWMAAVLPVFQSPKVPSENSRWIANDSSEGNLSAYYSPSYGTMDQFYSSLREELFFFDSLLFGSGSGFGSWLVDALDDLYGWSSAQSPQTVVKHDVPEPGDGDGIGLFGQARTSVGDWDFMTSIYRGPSIYPVLHVELDTAVPSVLLTVEHSTVDQLAGGFSTTWKELEFHGEAIYSYSEGGKDDSYVQYVIGSLWSNKSLARQLGLYRIDFGLEYAGESVTKEQDAEGYAISSRELRVGQNDFIPGLAVHFTEDVRFHYLADFELDNGSIMNRFGVEWDVTDELTTDVSVDIFDGSRDSYYGYWRDQDRVVTTLTYRF